MAAAYIPYVHTLYTARPYPHAHACAAKQSELVRRCIATTALFALSPGCTSCWRRPGLRPLLARFSRNKLILEHASALFAGKERVIASLPPMLERERERDPFGKPWNCVSCREIDRVNCAPVGERVPDLRSARQVHLGFHR